MKMLKRIIFVLFILSLLTLYIIIYAIPGLTGAFVKTEILRYGNLRITDNVTCYFVRDEKVYRADKAGSIDYYIGDSVHVKTGTKILRAGNTDFISEFNGITSYYIDGYEDYFTPESIKELKYSVVSELDLIPENVVAYDAMYGDPLYKLCDNKKWYIVCWVDAANISKYNKGKRIVVELPLGQVEATVSEIIEDGDKWLIALETDRYYEEFSRVRAVPAAVVPSDYSGIVVRNDSITVSDGAVGVYVKAKNGEFIFKPVRIITTDGKDSIVEASYYYEEGERVATVNIYDEILINPGRD